MATQTPETRRKKLNRLLLQRWSALRKRQTDAMVKRIMEIPDGEFEAAQAKTKNREQGSNEKGRSA